MGMHAYAPFWMTYKPGDNQKSDDISMIVIENNLCMYISMEDIYIQLIVLLFVSLKELTCVHIKLTARSNSCLSLRLRRTFAE